MCLCDYTHIQCDILNTTWSDHEVDSIPYLTQYNFQIFKLIDCYHLKNNTITLTLLTAYFPLLGKYF